MLQLPVTPPLASLCFLLFCALWDGVRRQIDVRIQCLTPEWWAMAVYCLAMLVLFTLGFPIAIMIVVRRHRNTLTTTTTFRKLGFLYHHYGVRAPYWQVEELARKLILIAIGTFVPAGSATQVCGPGNVCLCVCRTESYVALESSHLNWRRQLLCAVTVCAWAHVIHAIARPFTRVSTYWLQHAALVLVFLYFLIALAFQVQTVPVCGMCVVTAQWSLARSPMRTSTGGWAHR